MSRKSMYTRSSKLWEFVDDGQNVWRFLYASGRKVEVRTVAEFRELADRRDYVGWRKFRLDGII